MQYITVENLIYYAVLSTRLKLCQNYGNLGGMVYYNLSFQKKMLTNKMPVPPTASMIWSQEINKSFDKLNYFVCSNFIINI